LKIQAFKHGGYEATVRLLDLDKIGGAMEAKKRFGKREAPETLDTENIAKAGARAKRKVRHLVKNMAASHLCTLTRRETAGGECWTADDWAKAWDRLRRGLERVIGDFPYVAILEKHKKGNYHLHVAWCGKINLNLMRPLWWSICGGRGQGNVDAQYIKVRAGLERSDRVAKYISKYVTKSYFDNPRFNKKRYWASRQTMPEVRRYVLRSFDLDSAMGEVRKMLGLDWGKYVDLVPGRYGERCQHYFAFPDGGGVWFSFIPEIHGTEVPF